MAIKTDVRPNELFQNSKPRLMQIGTMIIRSTTHPRRYPHSHTYLEILLFMEGRCEYTHNARKYYLPPGTIAICNRGAFHAENFPGSNGRFLTLGVTGLSLPELRKDYLTPPDISPIVDAGVDFADFCALISVMKHLRKKGTPYSRESVQHLLCTFLLQLYEMAIAQSTPSAAEKYKYWSLGRQAKELMEQHYQDGIEIEDVAQKLHISTPYLSHIFKKQFQYTAIQYLSHLRIGEAQTILTETQMPISDIAYHIGYNSANNFYIAFKRITGISPSQYREVYRDANLKMT